jgi:mono/diheme cytochrome c family protein
MFRSGFAVAALLAAQAAVSIAQTPVERGRYLAEGIAACGNCHTARDANRQFVPSLGLSGGEVFDTPVFRAYASNITPDPETGIGKWTDAQLGRAIREGVRPDGSIIGPPMPSEFLRELSDSDLAAIIAYLRVQKPVRNAVPKSVYKIPLPPSYGPPVANVQTPPRSDTLKYGAYLTAMGHCLECHTPQVKGRLDMSLMGAGGRTFSGAEGQVLSRNLTPGPAGLSDWTDAQIIRAIQDGVSRDGNKLKPPMAYGAYKRVSDEDMRAVVAYLRSLKPLPFAGKQ